MEADREAPVFEEGQIQIAAPPETVWDVLADIEGWTQWNPDIKSVVMEGEVTEGAVFRWKSGPGTITSILRRVDRPRSLGWTGTTFGIRAVHVWDFEPRGEGTLVRTEESFDGFLPRILRGSFQRTLRKALDSGLSSLRAEAERRSGS